MGHRILQALMQLFAIITPPYSRAKERVEIVDTFLRQQLNTSLVIDYLHLFETYFVDHQRALKEEGKRVKVFSSNAVRVLKICTQINEELTQKQKITLILLLLEFIKSDNSLTPVEIEIVDTVADAFFIPAREYSVLKAFTLNEEEKLDHLNNTLIIKNNKDVRGTSEKTLLVEGFPGELYALNFYFQNLYFIRYFGENELYLNNQLLKSKRVYVLGDGASIKNTLFRTIYFSDIKGFFNFEKSKNPILYEAHHVFYHFQDSKLGLHDIHFQEESGKLVCIMGASGTGKTTLLNVLNGNSPPSYGTVKINGTDIHKNKQAIEGLIGYVSQDDLLIDELTVFENLYLNAKLCFGHYNKWRLIKIVLMTLQNLGLDEIKHLKVGTLIDKQISGGQRKRLNIALELIRQPAVLFLDEPTSGLSSRDSENIIDLLKDLTFKGKLIFTVLHQPSSQIFKMFDRLLILDKGGVMIYNGDPVESIIYFKSRMHQADWNESECHACGNVNPEQIFNIIESNVIDEYGNLTRSRKTSPEEWYAHFRDYIKGQKKENRKANDLPKSSFHIPSKIKQIQVFIQRDILSKISNKQYLFINLVETPLLAFLLSYLLKYWKSSTVSEYTFSNNSNLPAYLFVSVIIAIFIGLTLTAQEIIKDRKIQKREEFLHLSRGSYLMSKIIILISISALQALEFVLIGNSIMEIRGLYLEYWLVLFSTWVASGVFGLIISDSFRNTVTIYILIPFLLIPQLILSGVLVSFEKFNPSIIQKGKVPFYGEMVVSRWAFEALAVHTFTHNKFERIFYNTELELSEAGYRKNVWLAKLEERLEFVAHHYKNPSYSKEVKSSLSLIRNEIVHFLPQMTSNSIVFDPSHIVPEKYSAALHKDIEILFERLKKYYHTKIAECFKQKDSIINKLTGSTPEKEQLLRLKEKYYNSSLADLVQRNDENVAMIISKNRIKRIVDPIYNLPKNYFIKSHFYSPYKNVFTYRISTLWANLLVIWIFTGLQLIILYKRWFVNFFTFIIKLRTKLINRLKQ